MSTKNNNWINHVKQYANKKGISYRDALKSQACKSCYKRGGSLNITDMPRDVGNEISSFLPDNEIINLRQSNALPDNEEELTRRAHKEIGRRAGTLGKRDLKYIKYKKVMNDQTKSNEERSTVISHNINFIFNTFVENQKKGINNLVSGEEIGFLHQMMGKAQLIDDDIVQQISEAKKMRALRYINTNLPRMNEILDRALRHSLQQTIDTMGVV
jgi:hypothetical protein